MIAVYEHIASVIAQNGGDVDGGEENQGRSATTWLGGQGLHVFAFWHPEGWTPRIEATMEAVSSEGGFKSLWIVESDDSTCGAKAVGTVSVEKTLA